MGLSSDPNSTLNYSERETQHTFNVRDIVAAKVGSLLQDIIGLPSSFSRQYSGKSLWDTGPSEIDGQIRERSSKNQLTRLVEEVRKDDENAVEIPIKKPSRLESENSHPNSNTPSTIGRKLNEEEKHGVPNLLSHCSWEIIYSGPHHRAEADDKINTQKITDQLSGNYFFGSKNNSFINSSYMPFSPSSIACGFCDEAERFSRDSFYETFDRNLGYSSLPSHTSIFKPHFFDSTFIGNAITPKNSWKPCDDLDTSNYIQKPFQGENTVSKNPSKQISVMSNPFDGLFFDGAQTEVDLYNLFTNLFSFNKDMKNYHLSHPKQAVRDDCEVKKLSPFEKTNQELNSLSKVVRSDPEAERVVSTFSSTVQHMGPDGRLYTSVKTSKTFGDGRNSTTTRDYMQNIDLRRHWKKRDENED